MSLRSLATTAGHAMNGLLHRFGYHLARFPVHRAESLIRLIQDHGFRTYVEVGVWKAESSRKVLGKTALEKAWLIDPYTEWDTGGMSQRDIDRMYESVRRYFARRHPQVQLLRKTSQQALEQFENGSVDIVFVDGEHSYAGVKRDIADWWPKVRVGGVLAGDDFETEYEGIIRAICEAFPMDRLHFAPDSFWWVEKGERD